MRHWLHYRKGILRPGCRECRIIVALMLPSPGNIELAMKSL